MVTFSVFIWQWQVAQQYKKCLHFHGSSSYMNKPQGYVTHTFPVIL